MKAVVDIRPDGSRAVLSEPVLAKVKELTGETEALSTNPETGLQEFTTMPTEKDKAWSRRVSQWWPMRLFGMFKPSPTESVPGTQQGPSLLPKPVPPGKGFEFRLLTPSITISMERLNPRQRSNRRP